MAVDGLPIGEDNFADLAIPKQPGGPVLALSASGIIYQFDGISMSWSQIFDSGSADEYGDIEFTNNFDPAATAGPQQTIAAVINSRLFLSEDGGQTWTLSSQFFTTPPSTSDWAVSTIGFANDFATSGVMFLARGMPDPSGDPDSTLGELWRSTDFGQSFSKSLDIPSTPREIYSTSIGPSGISRTFMLMIDCPYQGRIEVGLGLLMTDDNGLSWTDNGTLQDFMLEAEVTKREVEYPAYFHLQMLESPDYANDGIIWCARAEGLFRSRDEGLHWRQFDPPAKMLVREMDSTIDSDGTPLVFVATQGTGGLKLDLNTETVEVLPPSKESFPRTVAASPNFGVDGTAIFGGDASRGGAIWFDPSKPALNQFGKTGWVIPPQRARGATRDLAISPFFDSSGTTPGSDMALIWSDRNRGLTSATPNLGKDIYDIAGNWMVELGFAPTWNLSSSPTDIYGLRSSYLFRLDGLAWSTVMDLGQNCRSFALDPFFSRPDNPRVFAGTNTSSWIYEILDYASGAIKTRHNHPGHDSQFRDLAVANNFDSEEVIYAALWGEGIKKLDLSATSPQWEEVGIGFPPVHTESLALSADFSNDRKVIAGTSNGLFVCEDLPGATWRPIPFPIGRDDDHPGLTYFSPNNPSNPDPSRPWHWDYMYRDAVRKIVNVPVQGFGIRIAEYDQDYLDWEGYASGFAVSTLQGPTMGGMLLEVEEIDSGQLIMSTAFDFSGPAPVLESIASISLPPHQGPVRFKLTALLDPGERLVFDYLAVTRD